MNEVVTLADTLQKLGTVGFGVTLGIILVGSYFGIWVWGKDYRKLESDKDKEIAKLEAEVRELKGITYRVFRIADTAFQLPALPKGQSPTEPA